MGRKVNRSAQIVDDEGENEDERGRNNVVNETILIDITIIS